MREKLNDAPNSQEMESVITGEAQPSRVRLLELGIDQEVERHVIEPALRAGMGTRYRGDAQRVHATAC